MFDALEKFYGDCANESTLIDCSTGELSTTFRRNLQSINVRQQAFASCKCFISLIDDPYSGSFTGNHVHRVLKRSTEIFQFLVEHREPSIRLLGDRWNSTFQALGKMQSLTRSEHVEDVPQLLKDWNEASDDFFRLHALYFPGRSITPKMHHLRGKIIFFS
jgi:hypothetical protein